ncbi:cytochrome c oxidase subunit VIII [Histoplasma capsulatum var. duboisii H88]|uniref:Cytochrome c oxidase subunit 8, mitochondrial n=4 Tax=Ajellomyces capsulatus TaxID=5037 RepID=C0NIT6_AJECG|nr:cytochrome c oxidase subunit 8p [Histoplasma capsulatum G186AR]EER43588.1 cytochrome c oxidase subunit 8p [Histoplasma capsulatum H143]EGC42115.1 cytochrome c oxidase subunit VIII [Histoplasma capsulatum var. duboisii H88]KAG5297523.1 cytochrome c oxidase subunit 8p [Histoplasma ohiense (nom. inval.)]KAG5303889.1 cytochrome c oxidase subunit 8p [Histoplasma capsulatum]EEH08806.1 cytochrome c oxidase subunit 8p [Histoplasma capsulatum G186AR]
MLAQSATRARMATSVARRGFHTTQPQMSSPFHYPEGPRTNLPFNPLTKRFAWRYWAFMATGFGLPFGIAAWQMNKSQ